MKRLRIVSSCGFGISRIEPSGAFTRELRSYWHTEIRENWMVFPPKPEKIRVKAVYVERCNRCRIWYFWERPEVWSLNPPLWEGQHSSPIGGPASYPSSTTLCVPPVMNLFYDVVFWSRDSFHFPSRNNGLSHTGATWDSPIRLSCLICFFFI